MVWGLAQRVAAGVVMATLSLHAQEPMHGLRDRDCSAKQVLIGSLEDVSVYAECVGTGPDRVMNVTVFNGTSHLLTAFSIGFCAGAVIALESPPGWQADRTYGDAGWKVAADAPRDAGVANGERLSGFSVKLRRGWVRSFRMSVKGGDHGGVPLLASTFTTHDCDF